MKRIDSNHVRPWCGILLAGWLLAGFAPIAKSGLFIGPFAPDQWTQAHYAGDNAGFYNFTPEGILVLQASRTPGFSDTLISAVNSGTAETVSFNWTLTANGNLGTPQAYFYVGTTEYPLIGSSGNLTGIEIPADTMIYFELVGDVASSTKAPAELTIVGVPEAGNTLAGLLVLAVAGYEWRRRKRTTVAETGPRTKSG